MSQGWAGGYFFQHPDTQQSIVGQTFVLWEEIKALCRRGALTYAGLGLQHWDIALDEKGPLVLEMNVEGANSSPQLAASAGILDDRLKRALAETA